MNSYHDNTKKNAPGINNKVILEVLKPNTVIGLRLLESLSYVEFFASEFHLCHLPLDYLG